MAMVGSKDTRPEIIVRSFLHRCGFRFRLHQKNLPGHPDIVLPKYKTVVEIRGCFWHHHQDCKNARIPHSNIDFWLKKFQCNVVRDKRIESELKNLGWNLIVVWECELKKEGFLEALPGKIKEHGA